MTAARALLLASTVSLLMGAPPSRALAQSPAPVLRGSLLGNGGGRTSGPDFAVLATVGQAAVGASASGSSGACSGFWCLGGLAVVAVGPDPGGENGAPLAFAFGGAFPNPTRGATTFRLALPRSGRVRLEAFDVAGRLLDAAVDKDLAAGRYELHWDARGAAPGVYFARLVVDGQVRARRRLVVLR